MATFKTTDVVGKKEDISDIVSNIDPTDTPFQSSIGRESVHSTLFQWQEDRLAPPRVNRAVEGFVTGVGNGGTPTTIPLTPTLMRDNVTQILEVQIALSGTNQAVTTYGSTNRYGYQMAKKAIELKRDLEHALVGTGQTKDVGSGTTPRIMAGYQAQIETSNSPLPAPIEQAPDGVAGGALDPSPLTEQMILNLNQKMYNLGSDMEILMIKPGDALKVAGFVNRVAGDSAGNTRSRDIGNGRTIVNAVDVYTSPFGTQRVVLNRWLRAENALLYDPSNWKLITLRGWTREKLAKDGDRDVWMMLGEFSLKHANFRASGLFTNLSA